MLWNLISLVSQNAQHRFIMERFSKWYVGIWIDELFISPECDSLDSTNNFVHHRSEQGAVLKGMFHELCTARTFEQDKRTERRQKCVPCVNSHFTELHVQLFVDSIHLLPRKQSFHKRRNCYRPREAVWVFPRLRLCCDWKLALELNCLESDVTLHHNKSFGEVTVVWARGRTRRTRGGGGRKWLSGEIFLVIYVEEGVWSVFST